MLNNIIQLVGINNENNIITNKNGKSFFKYDEKKYSKYGLEFRQISSNQQAEFNETIKFSIPNNGNILHRCFFQIEIPDLIFNDSHIANIGYLSYKNNKLVEFTEKISTWENKYINLNNYCNIQLIIYDELQKLLKLENLTLQILKMKINILVDQYPNLNDYEKLIEQNIKTKIDLYNYIIALSSLNIVNVKNDSNNIFKFININLKYYYSNFIYYKKKYDELNYGNIEFSWIENLSHHFITETELDINGIIDKYSNDILNILQLSKVRDYSLLNYYHLIGNNLNYNKTNLYSDNNNYSYSSNNIINLNKVNRNKKSNIIYTPLIFWFNQNSLNSLPIIAMEDTPIRINTKINNLKNLIYFQNYEKEFNNYLTIDIPREQHEFNSNNTIKEYKQLNYLSVELLIPEYIYRYTCSEINKTLLELHFPGIDSTNILKYYGTPSIFDFSQNVLNLNDWIFLRKKIYLNKTDDIYSLDEDSKLLLGGYDYNNLIDYNFLLNKISKPKIELLAEFGYVDDIDKTKLKMENTGYLIRTYHEYSLNLENEESNNFDINMNGLIDSIYYFNRPKLFLDQNLSNYGKAELSKYSNFNLLSDVKTNYIKNFSLNITSDNNLFIDDEINTNYYNYVVPYLYLNSILAEGIFYKNLCLYPNDYNPSGVFNTDILKTQSILISLDDNFKSSYFDSKNNLNLDVEFKIIYTKLNILEIKNNTAQLKYT